MSACICIAGLFPGLWSARPGPWVQVVWSDRIKPSVFLAMTAVLMCTAETTSDPESAWVVAGGQYFFAAAAVIAAAIGTSKQPQDSSITSGNLPGNAETAE